MAASDKNMIPLATKVLWGAGAGGVAFMLNVVAIWALIYMTIVLKMDPLLAGIVLFIPKLFDAVTDPLIGTISDRLKTNKSRRRPFLLAGAILSPLSFLMIFTTPIFDAEWMTAAYIFTALMIYSLAMTIFNIPYLAMPAEMTDDYHERTSIHSYRVIFYRVAGIVGLAVPLLIEYIGRDSWYAFALLGVGRGVYLRNDENGLGWNKGCKVYAGSAKSSKYVCRDGSCLFQWTFHQAHIGEIMSTPWRCFNHCCFSIFRAFCFG